jgi:hypothetical protein
MFHSLQHASNGRRNTMDQESATQQDEVVTPLTEEELGKVGGGLSDDFVLS